jgi:hypothetical protein
VILVAVWAAQVTAQTAGVGGPTTTTLAGSGTTTPTGASNTGGGNVQVQLNKAGDVKYPSPNSPKLPLGKKTCAQGTIEVTLSQLPNASQFPYLQVWLQTDPKIDCNTGDRNTFFPESSRCISLPLPGDQGQLKNQTYYKVVLPLGPVCDSSGDKTIYFLAMTSENNNDPAMFYGKLTITIDVEAPSAPTNVEGGTGETQIELHWDLPAPMPQYVWTLVDINATAGDFDGGSAECSSTKLRPGMEFDPTATPPEGVIVSTKTNLRTKETFNGESWGTEYGAAAVVVADLAGNTSKLSEIGCLHVVKTSGFWDRYQENGGKADSGWGCAIGRSPSSAGSQGSRRAAETVLPALFILGVWAARRRLRRRAR